VVISVWFSLALDPWWLKQFFFLAGLCVYKTHLLWQRNHRENMFKCSLCYGNDNLINWYHSEPSICYVGDVLNVLHWLQQVYDVTAWDSAHEKKNEMICLNTHTHTHIKNLHLNLNNGDKQHIEINRPSQNITKSLRIMMCDV